MTVKQEGPIPTPKPSDKNSLQSETKDKPEAKVEAKEKKPVATLDASTSEKDNTEIKENA